MAGYTYLQYDNSGIPTVIDPTGAIVATSTTTTAGLNEAFACAKSFGSPLIGDGNNIASASNFIHATDPIEIPDLSGYHVDIRGLDIYSTATGYAVRADTMAYGTQFNWSGKIRYAGITPIVNLADGDPTNGIGGCVWLDQPRTTIADNSTIHADTLPIAKMATRQLPFMSVVSGNATDVRRIDQTYGSMVNVRTFAQGQHGGLIAQRGIRVLTPTNPNNVYDQCEEFFGFVGACLKVGIQEGMSNPGTIPLGNTFWQGTINCDSAGMVAYYATFGIYSTANFLSCSINAGTVSYGILFNPGSNFNRIESTQIVATTKFANSGGAGNVVIP